MKAPAQKQTPSGGSANATQTKNDVDIITDAPAERKAAARLRAQARRAGFDLIELGAGNGFYLARWNYATALPDLRAVGALLRRIGSRP